MTSMGPCFRGMENSAGMYDNNGNRTTSMGPCIRGMENDGTYDALSPGTITSMGPCFRGMENEPDIRPLKTQQIDFNGAML